MTALIEQQPEKKERLYNESEVVRTLTLQLSDPKDIAERLAVTDNKLAAAKDLIVKIKNKQSPLKRKYGNIRDDNELLSLVLFDEIIPAGRFYTTSSCWMEKGKDAQNPGQLMLLGGKMARTESNDRMESPAETTVRQLAEEAQFFGLRPSDVKVLGRRFYRFDHSLKQSEKFLYEDETAKQIYNRETTTQVVVPPFLTPTPYDKRDKATAIRRLSPEQADQLLTKGYITVNINSRPHRLILQDSLSDDMKLRSKANVHTDGREKVIRNQALNSILLFEAQTKKEVVSRILKRAKFSDDDRKILLTMWTEIAGANLDSFDINSLRHFLHETETFSKELENYLIADSSVIPENLKNIFYTGRAQKVLARRIQWQWEIAEATRDIYFEQSLNFIGHTGPQHAFLMAQALLHLNGLTQEQYQRLSNTPEIKHLVSVACQAVEVDQSKEGWYEELRTKLREYRDVKQRYLLNDTTLPVEEGLKYLETNDRFYSSFCIPILDREGKPIIHIPRERLLDLIYDKNKFISYLDKTLQQITDKTVRDRLLRDIRTGNQFALDELILQMFGYSIYQKTPTEEFTPIQRYRAWVEALLIIRMYQADKLWHETIEPLNETNNYIFSRILSEPQDTVQINDDLSLIKYTFDAGEITVNLPGEVGEFPSELQIDIPATILSDVRVKDPISVLRKLLERGGEGYTIEDFNGRFIVIDSNEFWKEVRKKYKLPPDERINRTLIKQWTYEVTKRLLAAYEAYFKPPNFRDFGRHKVKQWRDYATPPILEAQQYAGSGASEENYSWLKFVQQATATLDENVVGEEIQIFPSVIDLIRKLEDDKRYDLERLFVVHRGMGERLPLLYILFGLMEVYEEVIRSRYAQNHFSQFFN